MTFIFEKIYNSVIFMIIVVSFKLPYCISLSVGLNVRDICDLSDERFPDNNQDAGDILRTYERCFEMVDQYTGKTRKILLKQLMSNIKCFKEDLKQSFYAGNVKYNNVELVENMEAELLNKGIILNPESSITNNNECNFARLARSTVKHIIPLVVTGTLSEKRKACEAIFKQTGRNITEVNIPTPKLDSDEEPKELTVPLLYQSVYRIDSPEAENALTQYYEVVMKCLTLTTEHKIQVFWFNKRFYDWLIQAVLPHLKDDKCYPAFGGVLRIVETMRQNDFVPKNATANFVFYKPEKLEKTGEKFFEKEDQEELLTIENCTRKLFSSPSFLYVAAPMLIFIIIVVFIILVCRTRLCACCYCGKRCDEESAFADVFYYPIEEPSYFSFDLDMVSSEHSHNGKTDNILQENDRREGDDGRQRGGDDGRQREGNDDSHVVGSPLVNLPVKRQWPSKESPFSQRELTSPEKRKKKMWTNY